MQECYCWVEGSSDEVRAQCRGWCCQVIQSCSGSWRCRHRKVSSC